MAKKKSYYNRVTDCAICYGKGYVTSKGEKSTCPECDGSGKRERKRV